MVSVDEIREQMRREARSLTESRSIRIDRSAELSRLLGMKSDEYADDAMKLHLASTLDWESARQITRLSMFMQWADGHGKIAMESAIEVALALLAERDAQIAAVRELHRKAHAVFSWRDGRRFEDPCPTCDGKAGIHECGCWAETDVQYCCVGCSDGNTPQTYWPCPTILALDANDAKGGAS